MTQIHHTAIIDENVKLAKDVVIGPYCVLQGNITINEGTILYDHVIIRSNQNSYIKIGKNNRFFSFCVIGSEPQDYKFKGESSNIEIGDNNIIREYVTINSGSNTGNVLAKTKNLTKICNNCYLFISSHVAHDVYIEDNVVLTNYAGIAGHCKIDHHAIIGGLTAVHQFVHIGAHAMIGMSCSISNDVPPYSIVSANKDKFSGANIIGLKRYGFDKNDIKQIVNFYKELLDKKANINSILEKYKQINNQHINNIIDFLQNQSNRLL